MNKKIIIIGGESFLAKSVKKFLNKNYNICSFSRSESKNNKKNYNLLKITKDLSKTIHKTEQPIFIFFNSITDKNIFIKEDIKNIEKIINVNLTLPITFTNLFIKKFFFQKPKFIFMSSSRAKNGDLGITMYSTTKNSLSAFAKNMAFEYGSYGMNFKVLLLGLFKGGMKNSLSKKTNKKILNRTFNNDYVNINSFLRTLEFAIEDDACNGSDIYCDNGYI